jgi:hypothetical protein
MGGDQPVARPLPTHRTTQTENKRTQTPMPGVGSELTITVFERAKTVHVLDCAAIVKLVGAKNNKYFKLLNFFRIVQLAYRFS